MKKHLAILIIFLLFAFKSMAFDVKVSILAQINSQKVTITAVNASYYFFENDNLGITLNPGESATLENLGNNEMRLYLGTDEIGIFSQIKIMSYDSLATFRLQSLSPESKSYIYPDALLIYWTEDKLSFLNCAEIDDYVAGVIEGEAGNTQELEMLKVQAILSRTYAIGHLDKHAAEGFMVCDKVHCQVYRGLLQNNEVLIRQAVDSTKGLIVTDTALKPIQAVFHANCGGQTCNSEDVWLGKVAYLRSVTCGYCNNQPNFNWKKTIPLYEWQGYFDRKTGKYSSSSRTFDGIYRRRNVPNTTIMMKDVRIDFGLKSALFDAELQGESIVLHGHGFGHGVGLCQQGAIEMAHQGLNFQNIINHYFTNVLILDKSLVGIN